MGEQCPKVCYPLRSDGRAVAENVPSLMIKWEQHSIICNPLESGGRTVVLYHDVYKVLCISESRTLTAPVLNVSVGLVHTLSAGRTGIILDSMWIFFLCYQ